ncbi:MAG: hypothetical protein ACQ9MH_17895 [Nitrospinales bacterium]
MKEIENLEKMLRENKLTRRQFITAAAAFFVPTFLPSFLVPCFGCESTPKMG